jgi:GNAT superfamily N-acetyltransferase
MKLSWREACDSDLNLLAEWNHQLIRDEGHRNPMSASELVDRMKQWLQGEYRVITFSDTEPLAYALFKEEKTLIYLRQLFVRRDRRGAGIGRSSFEILRKEIWSSSVRLTVDVLCQNQRAVAFWRSVGYRDYCLTLEIMPP